MLSHNRQCPFDLQTHAFLRQGLYPKPYTKRMPSFVGSPMTFTTPSRELLPSSNGEASVEGSVRLSCLNPDGRAVHSLSIRGSLAIIETHRLPLRGTIENNEDTYHENGLPAVIRTQLPEQVGSALTRDHPMELLCVEVESISSTTDQIKLPTLCVYTKKDAFLLELAFTKTEASETEGVVLAVTEPFEQFLIANSTSTSIIRIRQAPQRYMGYATMCPPKSMAMLTYDSMTNENRLILYQGDETTTTPLVHRMEHLDDESERLVDFCFCQSNAFSLLSSITAVFLKGTGDVFFAGPILFQGTVIPRSIFTEVNEYMERQLQQVERNSPKWNQYRAARQYLIDTFSDQSQSSQYLKASERSPSFQWPIEMQGPTLRTAEPGDFENLAVSIEPVFAGEIVGLVVGRLGGTVDFGLISPTAFLPRFDLQGDNEKRELDLDFMEGAYITRVDLRDEEGGTQPRCLALIRDPIMEEVVHCIMPTHIMSILTNTLKLKSKELVKGVPGANIFSPATRNKPRTTAWPCLDVTDEGNSIVGAVISGDIQFGHVLVCRLSNGSMVAVNLTEARQDHEILALGDSREEQMVLAADEKWLRDTQSLAEIVDPLFKQVIQGIDGLALVLGSHKVTSVTPVQNAVVMETQKKCNEEIILPIHAIREKVKLRQKMLDDMCQNHEAQLVALKGTLSKLLERSSRLKETAEAVEENAKSLSERSAAVLQGSKDLLPKITQAEYDYFTELKKLDDRSKLWMADFETRKSKADNLHDSLKAGTASATFNLESESMKQVQLLTTATNKMISEHTSKIREAEEKVNDLADIAGIESDPAN